MCILLPDEIELLLTLNGMKKGAIFIANWNGAPFPKLITTVASKQLVFWANCQSDKFCLKDINVHCAAWWGWVLAHHNISLSLCVNGYHSLLLLPLGQTLKSSIGENKTENGHFLKWKASIWMSCSHYRWDSTFSLRRVISDFRGSVSCLCKSKGMILPLASTK